MSWWLLADLAAFTFTAAPGVGMFVRARRRHKEAPVAPTVMPPEVDLILRLLDQPADWTRSRYHAFHPAGVGMWIANEDFGLSVSINETPASYGDLRPKNSTSRTGRELALSDAMQKALWTAYKRSTEIVTRAKHDQEVGAFAQRIADMYERRGNVVQLHPAA